MRCLPVRHHHFAHHENTVLARAVWINRDWFQDAIGALAFGLLSRAAVEPPVGKLFELWEAGEFLDLSLAAHAGQRRVTVEPDVFQFVFGHRRIEF